LVTFDVNGPKSLNKNGKRAIELMMMRLSEGEGYQTTNQLKAVMLKECMMRQIPLPSISIDEGGNMGTSADTKVTTGSIVKE
jgi:hypothetical protein